MGHSSHEHYSSYPLFGGGYYGYGYSPGLLMAGPAYSPVPGNYPGAYYHLGGYNCQNDAGEPGFVAMKQDFALGGYPPLIRGYMHPVCVAPQKPATFASLFSGHASDASATVAAPAVAAPAAASANPVGDFFGKLFGKHDAAPPTIGAVADNARVIPVQSGGALPPIGAPAGQATLTAMPHASALFDTNSAKLKSGEAKVADQMINEAKASGAYLVLEGRADKRGLDVKNMKLGSDRAAAIRLRALHAGIPNDHIIVKDEGSRHASQSNDPTAWQKDRSVEMTVTSQPGAAKSAGAPAKSAAAQPSNGLDQAMVDYAADSAKQNPMRVAKTPSPFSG